MLFYYLRLAYGSLRATPVVSLVTLAAMTVGIGVSMTLVGVHQIFDHNPFKDEKDLHVVRVDTWDPNGQPFGMEEGGLHKHLPYQDVNRLKDIMADDVPRTAVAMARAYAFPEDKNRKPILSNITLCHADFFSMFGAPFAYGSAWPRSADSKREPVAVISDLANNEYFGGGDNVGKQIRIGEAMFTIVGILQPWQPTPNAYDMYNNPIGKINRIFTPIDNLREQGYGLRRAGDNDSWGEGNPGDDPDWIFTSGEVCFVQHWAQIKPEQMTSYIAGVKGYVREQRALGRLQRSDRISVMPLREWMDLRNPATDATRGMMVVGLLFLLVCALNLMGLLLGKFVSRGHLMGIHRALGAPRYSVFTQLMVECLLIALVGAALGLGLTWFGLTAVGSMMPTRFVDPGIFAINTKMVLTALALAIPAGLMAGLVPAARACLIPPVMQIREQG